MEKTGELQKTGMEIMEMEKVKSEEGNESRIKTAASRGRSRSIEKESKKRKRLGSGRNETELGIVVKGRVRDCGQMGLNGENGKEYSEKEENDSEIRLTGNTGANKIEEIRATDEFNNVSDSLFPSLLLEESEERKEGGNAEGDVPTESEPNVKSGKEGKDEKDEKEEKEEFKERKDEQILIGEKQQSEHSQEGIYESEQSEHSSQGIYEDEILIEFEKHPEGDPPKKNSEQQTIYEFERAYQKNFEEWRSTYVGFENAEELGGFENLVSNDEEVLAVAGRMNAICIDENYVFINTQNGVHANEEHLHGEKCEELAIYFEEKNSAFSAGMNSVQSIPFGPNFFFFSEKNS